MRNKYAVCFMALFVMPGFAGCGGGISGSNSAGNATAKSQSCLVSGCHATSISKVTLGVIADEWKASIHYKMNAAGCADCHDASHNGGNKCNDCHGNFIPSAAASPERCGKCHGLNHPEDRLAARAPQHFAPVSTSKGANRWLNTDRAEYLSFQYAGSCIKCHNPHDTSTSFGYSRAWGESGMGNTWSGARASRDFKMFGTSVPANLAIGNSPSFTGSNAQKLADMLAAGNSNTVTIHDPANVNFNIPIIYTPPCVRCHTTTGFIRFVQSGFLDLKPFFGVIPLRYDYSKEVTGCDACHDDTYNFKKLRAVLPLRAYYNISTMRSRTDSSPVNVKIVNIPTNYPDFGYSNMCVACHSGRGKGAVIYLMANKAADPASLFKNVGSPSSHDFAGAATLGRRIGFEFYSSYHYLNTATFVHDVIGMSSTGATPGGPCITCHMNTSNAADSHLFEAVKLGDLIPYFDVASRPYSVSTASPGALLITEVTSNTCTGCHGTTRTPAFLNDRKTGYISSLAVLKYWVGLVVTTTGKWDNLGAGTGPKTMGASFNNGYLQNEPGAYIHNPLYARRLVYDSINWLMQYPANPQPTVFAAVSTATIKVGKTQVNSAIKWLYGKDRSTLTAADMLQRPEK